MVEPAHVGGAALVALAPQAGGGLGAVRDQHPALAGRQLLVGVEAEGGEVAAGPHPPSLGVDRAERLAGVLEDPEAAAGGDLLELGHRGGVAEDVDREDPRGALGQTRLGGGGIEVEGDRVDVAEDRPHTLIEEAVGRSDEAQRAGQDLVALTPAQRPDPEVQRGRPARDGDRVLDPEPGGEVALEALDHRAQREAAGAQHLEHEGLLALVDLRPGERDRVGVRSARGAHSASGRRTPASRPGPPRRPR